MCNQSSKDDCEECRQKEILWTGGKIAVGIWATNFVIAAFCWMIGKNGKFGAFGDSFGTVNALFSSIAVAGAVYAVILQQRELAHSRDAQERSDKSQKKQAEMQVASILLNGITHEMDFLRARHTQIHELSVKVTRFLDDNTVAVESRNLPTNLQDEAIELIHEAELIDLIHVTKYPAATRHFLLVDVVKALVITIAESIAKVSERRIKLINRRKQLSDRMEQLVPALPASDGK